MLAGAVASATVTPFDVIKTRMQMKFGRSKYTSIVKTSYLLFSEEGPRAFLKGIGQRITMCGLNLGIVIFAFEKLKHHMLQTGMV